MRGLNLRHHFELPTELFINSPAFKTIRKKSPLITFDIESKKLHYDKKVIRKDNLYQTISNILIDIVDQAIALLTDSEESNNFFDTVGIYYDVIFPGNDVFNELIDFASYCLKPFSSTDMDFTAAFEKLKTTETKEAHLLKIIRNMIDVIAETHVCEECTKSTPDQKVRCGYLTKPPSNSTSHYQMISSINPNNDEIDAELKGEAEAGASPEPPLSQRHVAKRTLLKKRKRFP